jgi:rubrerythrin
MSLIDRVRTITRRVRADVVCECRRCGTTVTADTDDCPECETGEITRYRIP